MEGFYKMFAEMIFSIALVTSSLFLIDYISFSIRSAPKSTTMGKNQWILGFISTVFIVFYFIKYLP